MTQEVPLLPCPHPEAPCNECCTCNPRPLPVAQGVAREKLAYEQGVDCSVHTLEQGHPDCSFEKCFRDNPLYAGRPATNSAIIDSDKLVEFINRLMKEREVTPVKLDWLLEVRMKVESGRFDAPKDERAAATKAEGEGTK